MAEPSLRIHLLGPVEVWRDAALIKAASRRRLALLAAMHLAGPRGLSRSQAAAALWPERDEKGALANLRQAVRRLRQTLPELEEAAELGAQHLRWLGSPKVWVDLDALRALLRRGLQREADLALLRSLYRGRLLEGAEAPWLQAQRGSLKAKLLEALEAAYGRVSTEDPPHPPDRAAPPRPPLAPGAQAAFAVALAEAMVLVDPLGEAHHRRLFRALGSAGRFPALEEAYQAWERHLAEGLGCAPSLETRALYEALLQGRRVELSVQPKAVGGIVEGAAGLQLIKKPEALLVKSKWKLRFML